MTRLEKKCLVASTGVHAALAALLALAPILWVSKRQELTLPVLTMIPSRLVDGATGGGGSPTATTTPPPAVAPAPKPLTLPPPIPIHLPPKTQPAQPKTELKSIESDAEIPIKTQNRRSGDFTVPDKKSSAKERSEDSGKTKGHRIELSLERDTNFPREKAEADPRAAAASQVRAAQQRFASGVESALSAISRGVASSTSIDVPGPGGEAFADYGQWVVTVYHQAWSPPRDLADDVATVTVEVIIRRDGSVESFKVTRRSGHSALDKSVARLESVRKIAPFPSGTTEETRRFVIDFNLHSKK
jgi:TonB family protein